MFQRIIKGFKFILKAELLMWAMFLLIAALVQVLSQFL